MTKPRVFISDDHILVLEGIRKLLAEEVDLVGTARNGRELISAACRVKPDIILLDISMPGLNGFEAARQLRKKLPGAKLIFLTMHADADYVADALNLGAFGYLLKSSDFTELTGAIQKVAEGQTYITPLVARPFDSSGTKKSALKLTERQREVLQLIAEGRCPKEISSHLGISVRTVEFHKYSIMAKLGLTTIADLTKYAIRHRLTSE